MARGQSRRRKLVPECAPAIDQWKYEIAEELGLPVGYASNELHGVNTEFAEELGALSSGNVNQEPYWGHISSRDAGAVGGRITQRLVQNAEQDLFFNS